MTGVPESERTAADFMQVRAALVRRLGGANEALVWTRIDYRAQSALHAHQGPDGQMWWAASRAMLADETGLTPEQVRHATAGLVEHGYLLAEQQAGYDRTVSYRTVINHLGSRTNAFGTQHKSHLGPSTNEPPIKKSKTTTNNALAVVTPGSAAAQGLCEELQAAIMANGSRKPTITKVWLDAARLMVDRDERTPQQVYNMIRWSQAHEFWRVNILSMPNLRAKYDQMRLQAMGNITRRKLPPIEQGRAVDAELDRREAERAAQAAAAKRGLTA